ncbi:hypothetical protein OK351_08210 [Glutamicibacter sp. MNS18]|uniref:hypothetical protein n=1 Tax=Glutamicibacter sp. MNS18 TaxID=2989817 RepID=UPI002235B74E|nr:hypothetical protein [Glutamicibacter sp. MNS18]MCW4465484.1 hypothetical protein [Glutamicibacter sp. MNS18]
MISRRILTIVLAASLGLLSLSNIPDASASSAEQGDRGLAFSTDGVQFSPTPPRLFNDAQSLVPGEEIHAVLWVRNLQDHSVKVSLETTQPDEEFGVVLGPVFAGEKILESNQAVSLIVRAWLPIEAGNETQNRTSDGLKVVVHAVDARPLGVDPEESDEPWAEDDKQPPDELPETGFEGVILLIALGALGLGGWISFTMWRRPRVEGTSEGAPNEQ